MGGEIDAFQVNFVVFFVLFQLLVQQFQGGFENDLSEAPRIESVSDLRKFTRNRTMLRRGFCTLCGRNKTIKAFN